MPRGSLLRQDERRAGGVQVLAGYGAALLASYAVLLYLGLPWSTLLGFRDRDPLGDRTALAGIGVLVVWSWQWLALTGLSLTPGLLVLAGLTLPGFLWSVRRSWSGRGPLVRAALWVTGAGAACVGVFATHNRDALSGSHPFSVSLVNNDLPLYALLSRHLLDHGFDAQGAVVGYDVGGGARNDVFGAFDLLASLSFYTRIDIAVIQSPLLVLAMLLTVLALGRLLRTVTSMPRVVCLAVALTSCATSMYFYSVGQGFFSQLFSLALFASALALVAERATSPERLSLLSGAGELALLMAGLVSIYPHMAFLGVPVLVGVAVTAALLRSTGLRSGLVDLGLVLGLGFAAALVVDGSRVVSGAKRTFLVGGSSGGWGEPLVQVSQLLGLQRFPRTRALPPGSPDFAEGLRTMDLRTVTAVALCLLLLGLLLRELLTRTSEARSRAVAWLVAAAAVPMVAYYLLFALAGPVYLPWKWMAFFQPLVMAAGLGLLADTAAQNVPSWRRGVPAVTALAPVLAVLAIGLTVDRPPHQSRDRQLLRDAAHDPALRDAEGVNVVATTKQRLWDAMWVGYHLDKPVVFASRSYFPVQEADPDWPTVVVRPGERYEVLPPGVAPAP